MLARLTVVSAVLFALLASSASALTCPTGATCNTLTVPLDHSGATPGTQPVAYALLPATGPKTGTIAFLAGGPGQSAIPLTADVADVLKPLRGSYDLLMLDQRGTGSSGAVTCDFDAAHCGQLLGDRRTFMTTEQTADDLEDVRNALGIDQLVVLGVSYGTKVAGEYARRFPQHTSALVLDSTVDVTGLDAIGLAEIKSAPRMLEEVCAENRSCKQTVPDPKRSLTQAAHRLAGHPLRSGFVTTDGKVFPLRITQSLLLNVIAAADLDPVLRSALPAAIASLARGDGMPFLHAWTAVPSDERLRFGDQDEQDINLARFFATMCVESPLPWAPFAPVAGRANAVPAFLASLGGAAAFAPFRPHDVYENSAASSCATYPPTPAPAAVATAGPAVRTLILSGRDDTRTPLEDAQRIATEYPNARLLSVADVGHSVLRNDLSGCAIDGLTTFLAGGEPQPCEQRTGAKKPHPILNAIAYRPATIGGVRPLLAKGRPGRTAAAVVITLEGVFHDAASAALQTGLPHPEKLGALRHGTLTVSRSKVKLGAAEWIKGVRVSGTITYNGNGTLTVSGPNAAAGTLRARKGKVDGHLGGVHVHD